MISLILFELGVVGIGLQVCYGLRRQKDKRFEGAKLDYRS
jgi:hypothetical protein